MIATDQNITFTDVPTVIPFVQSPSFRIIKDVPRGMSGQIEHAVLDFIASSDTPNGIDLKGFYRQTLQAMAGATILNQGGELWIGTKDNELLVYVLAHIGNDLDGKLSYHISQTWVRKDYRGNPIVKEWWKQIKQRASDCLCGHLVITSSRSPKAYERWLGDGMTHYACLLKMSL